MNAKREFVLGQSLEGLECVSRPRMRARLGKGTRHDEATAIQDLSDYLGVRINILYQWRTKGYARPVAESVGMFAPRSARPMWTPDLTTGGTDVARATWLGPHWCGIGSRSMRTSCRWRTGFLAGHGVGSAGRADRGGAE